MVKLCVHKLLYIYSVVASKVIYCTAHLVVEMEKKEKQVEEETETLKKRISTHPLYGLLIQTHMDCLKIGSISNADQSHNMKKKLPGEVPISSSLSQPELDHFMEAYCLALTKLKEALEEPQHETVAFINSMHLQLRDLISNDPQTSDPSTTSSGERDN